MQVDDTGIYLSSLAVTVILSALATLGILLFTVVVTLSIMLKQCQDQPLALDKSSQCASFALSAEVGNLRNWTLPQDCVASAVRYVDSGQYDLDFTLAVDAARVFLRGALVEDSLDGMDGYALTDMRKLANRMKFGVPEESSLGDGLGEGYGMLGQAGSGKLRMSIGQSKLAAKVAKKFKEKQYGSSGATSGLSSSLAFTPVQTDIIY